MIGPVLPPEPRLPVPVRPGTAVVPAGSGQAAGDGPSSGLARRPAVPLPAPRDGGAVPPGPAAAGLGLVTRLDTVISVRDFAVAARAYDRSATLLQTPGPRVDAVA